MERYSQSGQSLTKDGKEGKKDSKRPKNALFNVSCDILSELTASRDSFEALALKKGGVVLWLLQLSQWVSASQLMHGDKGDEKEAWAEKVGTLLLSIWTGNEKQSLVASLATRLTPTEVGGRDGGKDGGKDTVQLLIARLISALIKLGNVAFFRTHKDYYIHAINNPSYNA